MTSRRHEDDPHEVHEDDESEGYQAHPVPRRVNKRPPPQLTKPECRIRTGEAEEGTRRRG